MPLEQQLLDFVVVPYPPQDRRIVVGGEWGTYECTITLLNFGDGGPYSWLHLSNEVAKRMHRALGAHLSKVARDA